VTASDEALFPGYEPPAAEQPEEPLSAGQRLTRRQQRDVTNGVHPLTRGPLHPEATTRRHGPIAGHDPDTCHGDVPCSGPRDPFTCGSCLHRDPHGFPKCDLPGPTGRPIPERHTHGPATDVRAWWPACPDYEPTPS
jgi:hypothetical protein